MRTTPTRSHSTYFYVFKIFASNWWDPYYRGYKIIIIIIIHELIMHTWSKNWIRNQQERQAKTLLTIVGMNDGLNFLASRSCQFSVCKETIWQILIILENAAAVRQTHKNDNHISAILFYWMLKVKAGHKASPVKLYRLPEPEPACSQVALSSRCLINSKYTKSMT